VAVAAIIVFAAVLAGNGRGGQQYVVAAHPIPTGSIIGPGDLATEKMSLPGAAGSDAFRQVGALVGRTAAEAIDPGELVEQSMVVPVGSQPATRPVSIGVSPSSLAGLAPGSAVDVLATEGSGPSATVAVVMRGAVLMAVDNQASAGLTGSSTSVVTLGVGSLPEVEAVVQASQSGTVSLVAAEPSDGVGSGPSAGGSGPSTSGSGQASSSSAGATGTDPAGS
jgi:Flp pilus assembly protein CpaB